MITYAGKGVNFTPTDVRAETADFAISDSDVLDSEGKRTIKFFFVKQGDTAGPIEIVSIDKYLVRGTDAINDLDKVVVPYVPAGATLEVPAVKVYVGGTSTTASTSVTVMYTDTRANK